MYRNDEVYQKLVEIAEAAGIKIEYTHLEDVWGRRRAEDTVIQMSDDGDYYPNELKTAMTLGHEIGHILTGNESTLDPIEEVRRECECDLVGYYLYRLAELMAGYEAERKLMGM